jgi:hypothetical protein
MSLEQYQLIAGDWLGLERIINDLTSRVVAQGLGPSESPTFSGLTLTGFTGVLWANTGVVTSDAEHNILAGLQGGTAGEYYHLTSAQYSGLGAIVPATPLTANRLVASDGTGALVSVANLQSWIAGTTSQITVTDDTDGTITLSTPQDIATTSSPTYVNEFLDGYLDVDKGILAVGALTGFTVPTGAGTRLMWIPDKAAFRAGGVSGGQWDVANIGNYSFAVGNGATASAAGSVALGAGSTASNIGSICLGNSSTASGIGAIGLGYFSTASGDYAVTMGQHSKSIGDNSVAFGKYTVSSGSSAFAFGYNANSDDTSFMAGTGTKNIGTGQIAIGYASVGHTLKAQLTGSIAMGQDVNAITNSNILAFGKSFSVDVANSFNVGFGQVDFRVESGQITLPTTLSGLLKGTSGVVSTATVGTDYQYGLLTATRIPFATGTPATLTDNAVFTFTTASGLLSTTALNTTGCIQNTMATTDTQGLIIDGNTNAFTYTTGDFTVGNLTRKFIGSTTKFPSGGYGYIRSLTWDYDFSGTCGNFGITKLVACGGDSLNFSGDISLTAGGLGDSTGHRFLANLSTNIFNGTFASASAKNFSGSWYGGYFGCVNNVTYNITGAGTNTLAFVGGYFTTQNGGGNPLVGATPFVPTPVVSAGIPILKYCGGLFVGIGTTDGTSTSYGGWFSGTGCDNNYGVWSNAGLNVLAAFTRIGGTTDPTVALDVTGAILTTTSITAGTGFGCNGAAAQTAYASGGTVSTTAGLFGFGSDVERAALTTLVANIRLALVANGIMS